METLGAGSGKREYGGPAVSELDDIKTRKQARMNHRVRVFRGQGIPEDGPKDLFDQLSGAEADLDRAIAIAEKWEKRAEAAYNTRIQVEEQRDEARAAVAHACGYPDCTKRYVHIWNIGVAFCEEHHEKMMPTIVTKEDWEGAVAAVLAWRDAYVHASATELDALAKQLMADTQSYEQYR